jgi:hypothetical protein
MANKGYLQPSARGQRSPTDNTKDNGLIVNPPRMNEIGGFDKIKEAHGPFKNRMSIRRPGSSIKG